MHQDKVVTEDSHTPLVSKEVYYAVQQSFVENTRPRQSSPRSATSPNPLSNLVKCGHCGLNMVVATHNGCKKLICAGKKDSGKEFCQKKTLDLNSFLEQVTDELSKKVLTRKEITKQVQTLQENIPERVKEELGQRNEVEQQLRKTNRESQNLVAAIQAFDDEDQGPSFKELVSRLKANAARQKQLQEAKNNANSETEERIAYLSNPERIMATAVQMGSFLNSTDAATRKKFLRAFIKEIRLSDDGPDIITYSLPLPDPESPDEEPREPDKSPKTGPDKNPGGAVSEEILLEQQRPAP